ncbi:MULTISPECIES: Smr/MutS family protein [Weeksella]|uniref:Smr/MutS family protein n=1 Tax=Weeksella TaxID=1013 RepID=UPI0008A19963|nr:MULTISPECIES: Smr/MutS family protein [Weeksella]MDK7374482.1 Smr/MutS family protein [Weeksella virosa]OFM81869.1 hypothetical protein HMPREF2660_05825 [Weeksella sp. HMSC059D05]
MFQKGDKVKAIDDNVQGTVTKVHLPKIWVSDEHGFEYIFFENELILDQPIRYDFSTEEENTTFEKPKFKTFRKSHRTPYLTREVDLHIEFLVENTQLLNQSEILQIQLDIAREEIEKVMDEDQIRLILIHGFGKGVLKRELIELLYRYTNIEFYDANFREYHGNAIEVRFL